MKNSQKGFIVPVLLGIIAVLVIGGGAYFYKNKKVEAPVVIDQNPPSNTQINNSNWKTYTNTKQGYSFEYPAKLSLTTSGEVVNLSHSIVFDNYDGGCDMKGDAKLSKTLNDFNLSVKIVSGEVNPPYVDGNYSKGILNGKWSYMGAEGCGQTSYYFPIAGNRTLIVTQSHIQMLSPVVSPEVRAKVLAVPGVISYEESKVIFDQILASFKINTPKASNETTNWKTYTNVKYGLKIQYPPDTKITENLNAGSGENLYNFFIPTNKPPELEEYNKNRLTLLAAHTTDSKCIGSEQDAMPQKPSVSLNGVIFRVFDLSDRDFETIITKYCTIYKGSVYELVKFISNPSDLTSSGVLDEIISTFKFTK